MTLIVLAGGVYVGAKVIPPYWDYFSMQDPVTDAAIAFSRRAKEAEVRAELIAHARNIGVTLDEENVEIAQDGNFAVARVRWEVPLEIPMYRRTLRFQIEKRVPAP